MPRKAIYSTCWPTSPLRFRRSPGRSADASRPVITARYDAKLQAFLGFVLSQYVSEGVGELDQAKLPHLLELRYRAVSDAALELGGVTKIREAFVGFQVHLYAQ
jgi:type I restriction enzyme, R subunit